MTDLLVTDRLDANRLGSNGRRGEISTSTPLHSGSGVFDHKSHQLMLSVVCWHGFGVALIFSWKKEISKFMDEALILDGEIYGCQAQKGWLRKVIKHGPISLKKVLQQTQCSLANHRSGKRRVLLKEKTTLKSDLKLLKMSVCRNPDGQDSDLIMCGKNGNSLNKFQEEDYFFFLPTEKPLVFSNIYSTTNVKAPSSSSPSSSSPSI